MRDDSGGPKRVQLIDVDLIYPLHNFSQDILGQLGGLFSRRSPRHRAREVKALAGINLTVLEGERVGVFGRNGAGKSTLLRVIAGVYPPTRGERITNGSVQGLYDIGVGFEQYRTGRENILYRGLVMGYTPTEIREREKEIIAFSGLGERIDTPLQTYSTGMVVRLAFSISTVLRGDILVVDEIFAAGDARFQEKASRRMSEIMEEAKILIFCSHNLAQVSDLCTRGLWIDDGQIKFDGAVDDAIDAYVESIRND